MRTIIAACLSIMLSSGVALAQTPNPTTITTSGKSQVIPLKNLEFFHDEISYEELSAYIKNKFPDGVLDDKDQSAKYVDLIDGIGLAKIDLKVGADFHTVMIVIPSRPGKVSIMRAWRFIDAINGNSDVDSALVSMVEKKLSFDGKEYRFSDIQSMDSRNLDGIISSLSRIVDNGESIVVGERSVKGVYYSIILVSSDNIKLIFVKNKKSN